MGCDLTAKLAAHIFVFALGPFECPPLSLHV